VSAPLVALDGRAVRRPLRITTDVVIVGSGPAGATVARSLAARGLRVLVLEEGHEQPPASFEGSGVRAMARLYRDMGTSLLLGNCSMPYLQGVAVGGTSVINGAICWRLPPEVLEGWYEADPALRDAIPYEAVAAAEKQVEERLHVHPTEERVAGPKNLLLARGAEALGLAHRPIRRNVEGCEGAGRCIQGCPHGHKLSMDRSYLPDAVEDGAIIWSGVRAERVVHDGQRATGVVGRTVTGARVTVTARHAVVLAASAIQTPCLLIQSGLRQGPVGEGLSGHPGVSVTGRFAGPVKNYRGATQGHEVTGLRSEGLKFEALGFDLSILATRVPGLADELSRRVGELDHYAAWGAAIRATGRGRVRTLFGRPLVQLSLSGDDVRRARRAVRMLGETFLAAGATEVYPGVPGFDTVVRDRRRMAEFESVGPLTANAYAMSVTHLFGTASMGSDPAKSVVRPDFRHHAIDRLYVADSSVFPTNLGVNPQIAIMALASLCADRVARGGAGR
jgi:choline dehydrogenase-like flavoprotein